MGGDLELIFQGPIFYSQKDENLFFEWLKSLAAGIEFRGIGRDLHVSIPKSGVTPAAIRELVAIGTRYQLDLSGLRAIAKSRGFEWLGDEAKFWSKSVFG